MGVWGLLSFIQMHNPPLGQQVSFSEKRTREEGPQVIVVDGNALAYHLFQRCEECCWWDGGELRDFEASVRQWVSDVRSSGVSLRCVLDGMLDPMKQDTAVHRGRDNAFKVEATLSKLNACRGNYGALGVEGFVLPPGCLEILAQTLDGEGVPSRRALYEADSELAREQAEHNAIGVLSNDSDFICMRVPLLPLNEFRVSNGMVSAAVYQPDACAATLSLRQEALPMLACMCGNDFVAKELLERLHASLAPGSRPNKAWQVIRGSARMIREASGEMGEIGEQGMKKLLKDMLAGAEDPAGESLAALTAAVEDCIARYSSHRAATTRVAAVGSDEEQAVWLEQELACLRLSPNSLQQGRHGWAWLRAAIEYHSSGQHAAGACSRSRLVRRAVYGEAVEAKYVPKVGPHAVVEWAPWGSGYRKAQVDVEVKASGAGRGGTEGERKSRLHQACFDVLGEQEGIDKAIFADAISRLPPDQVLLGLSLRLLVTSLPRPSFEKKAIAAVAAASCVTSETFSAWRSARGGGMWSGKRDISLINASAALLAMIMAVNDLNDVTGRPYPPQPLAVLSSQLAHELHSSIGGVVAGIANIEGEEGAWKSRLDTLMGIACIGAPADSFVEGKKARKRRQQSSEQGSSKSGSKVGSGKSGPSGSAGMKNSFSLLMEGNVSD